MSWKFEVRERQRASHLDMNPDGRRQHAAYLPCSCCLTFSKIVLLFTKMGVAIQEMRHSLVVNCVRIFHGMVVNKIGVKLSFG